MTQFFFIILARFLSVYTIQGLFNLCSKRTERTFTFKEVTFLSYAGMMKGAICYGLTKEVFHIHGEGEHEHHHVFNEE
jgi:hypothetical protein